MDTSKNCLCEIFSCIPSCPSIQPEKQVSGASEHVASTVLPARDQAFLSVLSLDKVRDTTVDSIYVLGFLLL